MMGGRERRRGEEKYFALGKSIKTRKKNPS